MRTKLFDSPAFTFVLMMGVVNLFGDMTYEGGASINGPFMGTLGASAAIISVTAGLGEFLGYSLRSVSGYIADKTGRYWAVTLMATRSTCWPSQRWRWHHPGIGYSTQDTLLKALIASVLPEGKQNLAFGLFYLGYGSGWVADSVVTGLLYDQSRLALIVFAVAVLLASVPFFLLAARADRGTRDQFARG